MSVLLLSRPVWAVDAVYNTSNQSYPSYGPQIAATNFLNDSGGTFSLTLNFAFYLNGYFNWEGSLYHGWSYTQNFTNNLGGEMDCDTGFYFDTQTPTGRLNYPASTFYNGGTINNGNGFSFFSYGGIEVWASNIYNPGNINIGQYGLGKFSGNNLDFSGGSVVLSSTFFGQSSTAGFFGENASFGLNTNAWSPGGNLSPNYAYGSSPVYLYLNNSTAYLDFQTNNASSNIIVRAVFLLNLSSNTVPANVYYGSIFGTGGANIEWAASYINPVDGTIATNYLYLENDYLRSVATNIVTYNGIPDNFNFYASPVSLSGGFLHATNTGFPPGFNYPAAGISNRYSFVSANLTSSSVDTNETNPQDFRQLTNLLSRIEITATNNLTLSQSTFSGMNYIRFNSPNQYNNDGSSSIISPYADAYLGATNGSLTVSNLFANEVPGWGGNIQAWSTRWTNGTPDANGFTYDYRVMLVQSSGLIPFNQSVQQDVVLYSSNNVVISDKLNIIRKLSMNCTNLLLTTNLLGAGAASFSGELNLNSLGINWASSLPQLRVLTNNGAIRTMNLAQTQYGTAGLPYLEFINTGTISNSTGAGIVANDVQSSGSFSAGTGSFSVSAQTVALTNGVITAGGSFSSTSGSLIIGGNSIFAGNSLTLAATNLLTDNGVTNGNVWVIGGSNNGSSANGLMLPVLPAAGDLLGTTVTNVAVSRTKITDQWAGRDYGATPAGFHNNAALGQLILDAQGANPNTTRFTFNGVATGGATNALYVDCLQLADYTTNLDAAYNVTNLFFNTNLVIYYAQALRSGFSIAEKLNHKNGDHLRWVPTYAGYFSSTNVVYPAGVTNTVNAALASSPDIDSNGNGSPNNSDPTPLFVPAQVNFTETITNLPPKSVRLQWATIPNGTNYIYYTTNLLAPVWQPLTNFNNYYYGPNLAMPNSSHLNWFASPQAYPGPVTNVWIYDPFTNAPHFYRVMVQPWLTYPF